MNVAQTRHSKPTRFERSRELYRYLDPATFVHNAKCAEYHEPEGVLVAQLQLVAWRFNARKCIATVVDQGFTSSFAAGLKSQRLDNPMICDDPADTLWSGSVCIKSDESVCPYTIELLPSEDGTPVFFEVPDMSTDPRFCNFAVVTKPPHIKYYYGAPLFTKRGIAIGALCVLDEKAREPMNASERIFLQSVAENVMSHLSLLRDRKERSRATRMSRCLNKFVDPTGASTPTTPPRNSYTPVKKGSNEHPPLHRFRSGDAFVNTQEPGEHLGQALSRIDSLASEGAVARAFESQDGNNPLQPSVNNVIDMDGRDRPRIKDDDHVKIYKSAVRLLKSSLDLEHGGGVLFLDTVAGAGARSDLEVQDSDPFSRPKAARTNSHRGVAHDVQMEIEDAIHGRTAKRARRSGTQTNVEHAEVLASSIINAAPSYTPSEESVPSTPLFDGAPFISLSVEDLSNLITRYPRGKVWMFRADGQLCSDSDDDTWAIPNYDDQNAGEMALDAQEEATMLRRHFPNSYQIMLIPIFDPQTFRWVAYFAYSTSRFRTFSYRIDFLYSVAFCNCIAIAKARLAALASDQQKGDFIGSISHELRTPLHGILASCEFLRETEQTTFQQSLVGTVESCTRTLSDTISMVLDYSKMNSFEREKRNQLKPSISNSTSKDGRSGEAKSKSGRPASNIYRSVDLAAITEEVIEGCRAGHIYKKMPTLDLIDIDSVSSVTTGQRMSVDSRINSSKAGDEEEEELEIILQIAPGDWSFSTQPGPFRRVVMNLVGNALKYTQRGWVKVELDITRNDDTSDLSSKNHEGSEPTAQNVRMIVSDTGKGISPEFLKSKLFVPFAQESTLSTGTGLGLSLVRSIIMMLGGNIDIRSKIGDGTVVTVDIPMEREVPVPSVVKAPAGRQVEDSTNQHDSIGIIREKGKGLKVTFYSSHETNQGRRAVGEIAVNYCKSWYGMKVDETAYANVDIIITDERDMGTLLEQVTNIANLVDRPAVVVFYSSTPWHPLLHRYSRDAIVEFVWKPIGPYRLARALSVCVDRLRGRSRIAASLASGNSPFDYNEFNSTEDGQLRETEKKDFGMLSNTHEDDAQASSPSKRIKLDFDAHSQSSGNLSRRPSSPQRRSSDRGRRPSSPSRKSFASSNSRATFSDRIISTTSSNSGHVYDHQPSTSPVENAVQPSIIVVDDNVINRRVLEVFLRRRKYTSVASATNGQEAVDIFKQLLPTNRADIIFMDISMPVLNGNEATKRIRKIELEFDRQSEARETDEPSPSRQSLIIALTGLATDSDQSEAFSAGANLYMSKPVSLKEIDRILDNWKKSRANQSQEQNRGTPPAEAGSVSPMSGGTGQSTQSASANT